jgi:WD40 repeat protein
MNRRILALAVLGLLVAGPRLDAQGDRRQVLRTPGLVLETGAPTAWCRALTYTHDGRYLVAAGDDKVVRLWPVREERLDTAGLATLRWMTWREQRGTIFALALSPDTGQRQVAVAGIGAMTGNVAVLDRETGKVLYMLVPPADALELGQMTLALAFSPSGRELALGKDGGSVWVWNLEDRAGTRVRRLGTHGPRPGAANNRVSFLGYLDADRLVSAAEDGRVLQWRPQSGGGVESLAQFQVQTPDRFAFAANGAWLAGGSSGGGATANRVEIISLVGEGRHTVPLPQDSWPSALALAQDGHQLAVGIETIPDGRQPWDLPENEVRVFALDRPGAADVSGFKPTGTITALAFSPDAHQLAAAGGANFELSLWKTSPEGLLQTIEGVGKTIWQVAFSEDRQLLGLRRQVNSQPGGPNDRASGPWEVFDLEHRQWAAPGRHFTPVRPLEELEGWRADISGRRDWSVISPSGRRYRVPLMPHQDLLPRCYTFIKPPGAAHPQLAVGHQWGVSVFSLAEEGVRRIRLAHGHAGPVTSVAPSADHRLLVTASRDQTISCFHLTPWPHERELGASFAMVGGHLTVEAVADGSPAWEAGLSRGDEIESLLVNARPPPGGPSAWRRHLAGPTPNVELFFTIRRPGLNEPLKMLTTVRQRPLWRFFPAENHEWVLWRWQDYFYDCSAHGDSYIGWQVNGATEETPEFFRAEQFRKDRHRPDKVREAIESAFFRPERGAIADLLPPRVEMQVNATERMDEPVVVDLRVSSHGPGLADQPRLVALWINDHKYRSWEGSIPFARRVEIPRSQLHAGQQNVLVAQAYSSKGTRGDSQRHQVAGPPVLRPGLLHGLFVGVRDYSQTPPTPDGFWPSLTYPVQDAEAMHDAWLAQAGSGLLTPGRLRVLKDFEASPQRVLQELRVLQKIASPDDMVIVFLAGHGWAQALDPRRRTFDANRFAFVCPHFEVEHFKDTGITSEALYDALVALPARKLVFIDACHAGSVRGADHVRSLTPDGIGPPIFTAAGRDEAALEHPAFGHGLFTRAILDALTVEFTRADRQGHGLLSVRDLGEYLAQRVPELLNRIRSQLEERDRDMTQTPEVFPDLRGVSPELLLPIARGR